MTTRMIKAISAVTVLLSASAAQAGFVDFVIRGTPTITYPGAGQTDFLVPKSGDKAGLGSNDINGHTLGSLQSVAITRLDDPSRFKVGSGPRFGPYLNFWITDGAGNYAVVANEPTNPDMQGLYNNGWDLSAADLANTTAKIYENSDKSWLPVATRDTNNDSINDAWAFSDLFSYEIKPPSVAELTASWGGAGFRRATGAEHQHSLWRELDLWRYAGELFDRIVRARLSGPGCGRQCRARARHAGPGQPGSAGRLCNAPPR